MCWEVSFLNRCDTLEMSPFVSTGRRDYIQLSSPGRGEVERERGRNGSRAGIQEKDGKGAEACSVIALSPCLKLWSMSPA